MESIDDLSVEALENIDQVCCQFESDLRSEKPPDFEKYLSGFQGLERKALLRELIVLDVDYRRRRKDSRLQASHYYDQFPQDHDLIKSVFAEGLTAGRLETSEYVGVHKAVAKVPVDDEEAPECVGRYRILSKIAAGGGGVVYRGFDEELHREVAVKIPHRNVVSDGRQAARFLTEARIVASLSHTGIVPVYDAGRTETGQCYVVSKFMEGGDLRTRIQDGQLSIQNAVELVVQIAGALSFAHQKKLVHRDVKPSNLLTDLEGNIYVADFGAAIQEDSATELGFVGTPAYMSPEQARGESHRIDARTDIFSLGLVLYELLTGARAFQSQNVSQLLADVIGKDPTPPQQLNENVPAELERICLKAIAKRATARYQSAHEFRKDLLDWQTEQRLAAAHVPTATTHIIPKGLRSFGKNDSEFFLQLLPGPLERDGLPECVGFWTTRLESMLPNPVMATCVIYGPSGCGKSSLVKAGILPRLGSHIRSIYVEARSDSTEVDLLRELQRQSGFTGDLAEVMRQIRGDATTGTKTLIIIDQFEQWLHSHRNLTTTLLARALRQCDGSRVQCLLLTRDDFWMPLVRFMGELEVPLIEGENNRPVDLFDVNHAMGVLRRFGQAFGRLPATIDEISNEQNQFLKETLNILQQDGTVNPIRLSLFSELMKRDNWLPDTLKRLGGADGLGLLFLNRIFCEPQSLPANRTHTAAARRVLRLLLPAPGVEIRTHLRSESELLKASGYTDEPSRFEDLMKLLDNQLRLVTPTDPAIQSTHSNSNRASAHAPRRFYQLTHDLMLSPIRDWVSEGQKKTFRGRAEICLTERTSLWQTKTENRQLPGLLECFQIFLFTNAKRWTLQQRQMLKRAFLRSAALVFLIVVGCVLLGVSVWHSVGSIRAKSAMASIRLADNENILDVIKDVYPLRRWLVPLAKKELDRKDISPRHRRNLRLTLLPNSPQQTEFLCRQIFDMNSPDILIIRTAIKRYGSRSSASVAASTLWKTLDDTGAASDHRFRAASALAGLEPWSSQWNTHGDDIVRWLFAQPINRQPAWLESFQPISEYLMDPLERVFLQAESETTNQMAAFAIAFFLDQTDELRPIVQLIKAADPSQIPALVETLRHRGDEAVELLKQEAQSGFEQNPSFQAESAQLPENLAQQIEAAAGIADANFLMCQTLELDAAPELIESVKEYGYRPIRLRPYFANDRLLLGAIWVRDQFEGRVELDVPIDRFRKNGGNISIDQWGLQDLATYQRGDQWRAIAVWSNDREILIPTRVSVLVPYLQWQENFRKGLVGKYRPFTIQTTPGPSEARLRTQIWRKPATTVSMLQRTGATKDTLLNSGHSSIRDVSIFPTFARWPFAAIFESNRKWESKTMLFDHANDLPMEKLRNQGYVPSAIGLSQNNSADKLHSVSIWKRPVPTHHFEKSRANVIASLVLLDQLKEPNRFMSHSDDPTLRSYMIQRIAETRVPISWIMKSITDESLNAETRQAIILSLGAYPRETVLPTERLEIAKTLREIYSNDPHGGVHSAAEWAMKKWNLVTPSIQRNEVQIDQAWYVTQSGQTMVVLQFPDGFKPKSAISPPAPHRFAIATTEMTIQDFARIFPEHPVDPGFTSEATCPANSMNWFKAAHYCNLLNEQEGIPASEWCYQPNEDGEYAPGMTICEDFLERRGYRLPLAAEWLYAASAATRTKFFFGRDPNHMARYSWFAKTSHGLLHPVGTRQPNRFGLFDVYGNVKEWSHSLERDRREDHQVNQDEKRSVLGGAHFHFERHLEFNYAKHGNPPLLEENRNGFRIARTVLSDQQSD